MNMTLLDAAPAALNSSTQLFISLGIMVVMLVFFIYLPQKKQEKKDNEMRTSMDIGDEVTTIGGIVGRVTAIKDDTFVMETGSDRVKIRFKKSAIASLVKLDMSNSKPAKK